MVSFDLRTIKKHIPRGVFPFFQPLYHFSLSLFAAVFYGFPARRLTIIGITGTKGKTTVVELLHEILSASGLKTASLSSLRFKIGETVIKNDLKMTMPGRFFIQKFLHDAKEAGATHIVLEVTSEGIRQFRHRFIGFDMAVMTNIAPEHIESHGSFEKYLRAKLDLFWRLKKNAVAVINQDDPHEARFRASTGVKKIFYGREGISPDKKILKVRSVELSANGIVFDLERDTLASPLIGEFNFYNILAATAAGLALHISAEKIGEGLKRVALIPGRMEYLQRDPFGVVVDYAHTPDSLRFVYRELGRRGGSLVCVLGAAGGGRDSWKRKEFGKIASEFCKTIIVTNEDPYDEDPERIVDGIISGIPNKSGVIRIMNRREAIARALREAQSGDTVVITGKGAEPWIMGPAGTKTPWDDREVAREELKKL